MPDERSYENWIVQDILPCREVHILIGPSGSGKTTWLLQTIEDWSMGYPVLGHPSYPTTFAYICCDRSAESMLRTVRRVRVDENVVPIHSLRDFGMKEPTVAGLIARFPEARLLVLESMAHLVPGGKLNDYKTVAQFVEEASRLCQRHDLTIIGTMHSPKQKEQNGLSNYREYALGSVAWGGFVETVIVMEPVDQKDEDEQRRLIVLPRNSAKEEYEYYFGDGGRLLEVSEQNAIFLFDVELRTWESNANITWHTIRGWMGKHDVSRTTAWRWLNRAVAQGRLQRMSRGAWRPTRRTAAR